jgi:hypothetical protein
MLPTAHTTTEAKAGLEPGRPEGTALQAAGGTCHHTEAKRPDHRHIIGCPPTVTGLSARGGIRTPDFHLRRVVLYPD